MSNIPLPTEFKLTQPAEYMCYPQSNQIIECIPPSEQWPPGKVGINLASRQGNVPPVIIYISPAAAAAIRG